MYASVRTADRVIVQMGDSLGERPDCVIVDLTAEQEATLRALAEQPHGGIVLDAGGTFVALPVVPPDPALVAAQELRAAIVTALHTDTATLDPTLVQAAIARLGAIIASGSVPDLPASPTNADVVAQVRTLTTAVNLIADATRDLARFDRAVIRLLG